jgi:hypothetical protein
MVDVIGHAAGRAPAGTDVVMVMSRKARRAQAPVSRWARGDITVVIYLIWTWNTVWALDPSDTAHLTKREDPVRACGVKKGNEVPDTDSKICGRNRV